MVLLVEIFKDGFRNTGVEITVPDEIVALLRLAEEWFRSQKRKGA